jgi:SAM-dependent methyltransferase
MRTQHSFADRLRFLVMPRYTIMLAKHDLKVFENLLNLIRPFFGDLLKIKILDVGCGKRATFTLLFHSLNARVTGIDVEIGDRRGVASYLKILKCEGFQEFMVKLFYDFYLNTIYYHALEQTTNLSLKFEDLDLRRLNASHTCFNANEFDLVISNAVFEHIHNLNDVLAEMKRIMKPNAIMYSEIHLFPSLTGGHNTLWSDPESKRVILGNMTPWDHLSKRNYPIDSSLNMFRENEYYSLFNKHFRIEAWLTEYVESEHFLTEELRSVLKDYKREELLKRSIIVIARKIS